MTDNAQQAKQALPDAKKRREERVEITPMRRIRQIVIAGSGVLFAWCDDDALFHLRPDMTWHRLPDIPQPVPPLAPPIVPKPQ